MALDFPSSPTNGQTYGNYYYDATVGAWNSFSSTVNPIPSTLKNLSVTTDNIGLIPLTVTGASGQTANLQVWRNSGGTYVASINNSGVISADTLNLANDLTVSNGGTGAGTFTVGAYLKGNGTSAIQSQVGIPFADVTMQSIGAAADLNTYVTQGIYHQSSNTNAAGGANYPAPYSGLLEVFQSGVDGSGFTYQRYTVYQGYFAVYTRAKDTTTWSAWKLIPFNDSPTFTGTVVLPSTTSIGNVSSTEIGYIDGVTSAIQTQLNSKANISGQDFSGKIGILGVGSQTTVGAANGTGGLEVQSTSTTAASMSFHIPGIVATNIGLNKTDSKFSIGGWSLPTDSLTIDTGGRIRKPYNPLFSGTDTRALVVSNAVLTSANCYNQIDYNVGNHFNASTGRFTAPVDGYYEASAHIGDAASNSAGTNLRISKNGALNTGPLAEGYNMTGTGATNVFIKAYIYCAAGDYIEFQAAALNTLGGVQHKRFLVRLIQ